MGRGQGTGALRISKMEEVRAGACCKQGLGWGFGDGWKRPDGSAGTEREVGWPRAGVHAPPWATATPPRASVHRMLRASKQPWALKAHLRALCAGPPR